MGKDDAEEAGEVEDEASDERGRRERPGMEDQVSKRKGSDDDYG